MKRQVRAHERLHQHVLTKIDRPERIAAARIELQHDVGRMLLGKDVDPVLDEPGIRVAALAREIGPASLQCLVCAVAQHTAALEAGRRLRGDERRVRRGVARELHVELPDAHGLAGHDHKRHVPAVTHAVLLRLDPRLVVPERLERLADARRRGRALLLDARRLGVARLLVEGEIREHVGGHFAVDALELDRRVRLRHHAQRQERAPRPHTGRHPCRTATHALPTSCIVGPLANTLSLAARCPQPYRRA